MEDVHHHVHEVHQHPFGIPFPFGMPWLFAGFFPGEFFHGPCDGLHLGGTVTMADDEVIGYRVGNIAQIEMHDILAFHFLDASYDRIHQTGGEGALRFLHPVYLGSVQRYKVTKCASGLIFMPFNPSTRFLGKEFIALGSAESTNKTAAELIRSAKAGHGAVILAHEQTAGQGQRGRSWTSVAGQDLTFSVILKPQDLRAEHQFVLSRMVALAVHQLVQDTVKGEVRIKWPNDVLVERRKIAGILIQNDILGESVSASIIGIGLNVNNRDLNEDLLATSLALECGHALDRMRLLEVLCQRLEEWYLRLEQGDVLMEPYTDVLWAKGRWAELTLDGGNVIARPMDVDHSGRLILELEDGNVHALGMDRVRFASR